MKIMFATDIHGSLTSAKKIVDTFVKEEADTLVLLGDLYYHGIRNPLPDGYAPNEVAKLLNSIKDKIIAIKGNCDSEVDEMVSEFDFSQHREVCFDGVKMTLTHGHIFNKDNLPNNDSQYIIHGHTHINEVVKVGNKTVINLASATIPKEDSPKSYMIFENKQFLIKKL